MNPRFKWKNRRLGRGHFFNPWVTPKSLPVWVILKRSALQNLGSYTNMSEPNRTHSETKNLNAPKPSTIDHLSDQQTQSTTRARPENRGKHEELNENGWQEVHSWFVELSVDKRSHAQHMHTQSRRKVSIPPPLYGQVYKPDKFATEFCSRLLIRKLRHQLLFIPLAVSSP